MPRYRSRSRSYSPRRRGRASPAHGRKRHDDDDRHRDSRSYRDRRSPAPSGLLVRNLPLDARPEELCVPFERYGPVKDVYLPKDYYSGEPRGFGFVKFRHAEDAAEAKQNLNHTIFGGREIRIVFAEENRKTPQEMRKGSHTSGRYRGSYGRRTPSRSPRRRYHSYSQSPLPAGRELSHKGDRSRGTRDSHYSPRVRSISQSPAHEERDYRPNKKSHFPEERDDKDKNRSLSPERDYRSKRSLSPEKMHGRCNRSPLPLEKDCISKRSYSPQERDYKSNNNVSTSPDDGNYRSRQRLQSAKRNGQSVYDEKDSRPSKSSGSGGYPLSP